MRCWMETGHCTVEDSALAGRIIRGFRKDTIEGSDKEARELSKKRINRHQRHQKHRWHWAKKQIGWRGLKKNDDNDDNGEDDVENW